MSSSNSSDSSSRPSNHQDLIDQVPWKRANEVIKGLFVGSLDTARSMRFLAEKQITAILSVCTDFVPAEDRSLGMMHYRIPIVDEPMADLLVTLPHACMFIATALAQGRNILIHSGRGQSRAPAVVAAYLMQTYDLELGIAMERLRKAHEPTWLIPAFQEQLFLFALCAYRPGPGVSYYDAWKARIQAA